MDFESANAIGQAGEREVSQALQRLSVRYGFKQLDNVVLSLGRMTAQLDHVVVDRQGVLLIESKVRTGARILGNDVEKRWTASYGHGHNKPFQNPIAQNREHENMVRQALRQGTAVIEADDIESIVVFVGADTTHLDLKSAERSRVLDVKDLERYFAARDARQSDRVAWTPEWVDYWLSVLLYLDKSADAETLHRHAAYRQGGAASAPVDAAPPSTGTSSTSPSGGVGTYSTSARRPARSGNAALRDLTNYIKRVAAMLVFLLLMWVCAVSGVADWGIRLLMVPLFQRTTTAQPAAAPSPPPASTRPQQQQLRALAPDIYDKVTDLGSPQISQSGDETTYTWHYLSNPTPSTAVVRRFSIVFGPDGKMRRMGASK